jgi:cell division protein FtsB
LDHHFPSRRSFDGGFYDRSTNELLRMKSKNHEKTNASAKIFSGMFFLAGLAVLVLIGISLGKEVYRKRQIQKEIEGLQSQINQLGQQNGDMQNLISYLSSTDFQEKEAREKLNLQKSDEKMIVLRKDVVEPNSQPQDAPANPQATSEDNSPNWQKWLKYFFAEKS